MTEDNGNQKEKSLREWLPALLLKFLVFLTLAFVVVWTVLKSGGSEIRSGQVWIIIAGMEHPAQLVRQPAGAGYGNQRVRLK